MIQIIVLYIPLLTIHISDRAKTLHLHLLRKSALHLTSTQFLGEQCRRGQWVGAARRHKLLW